ncbi:ATP-binding cassette domain-containing protein [Candidatus Rariloculus sp.]|uniref:ABC transporter ATP-binding protein n=1 Tax=Candidatus Rariloculus sp. TaxID=3101265 RepID=UPI003D11C924
MLEARQINFGYGPDPLFLDTDLTLTAGHIYGLLGLNGAGKSTLLKLMTGLLFPNSGQITSCGYDPAQRAPGYLSKVFLLPEELNVPGVSGREFVAVRSPFYPDFDQSRMQRYLDEFEIPGNKQLTALSHGQQKKFLLSFGLACNASLVLLDEPTNGLDIPSKGLFRRLVAEALSEDRTVVVSTHQVRDVESLVDLIVILHEGTVLLNHPLTELSSNLRVSISANRPDDGNGLIYTERTVGGYASVWKHPSSGDGGLDLELLFKAAIASPETCASLLASETKQ